MTAKYCLMKSCFKLFACNFARSNHIIYLCQGQKHLKDTIVFIALQMRRKLEESVMY